MTKAVLKTIMESQIAWIGVGIMGKTEKGMVKNITQKAGLSKPIIIYDISEDRLNQVHAEIQGTVKAKSIKEAAARAQIIFYSVPDDRACLSVLNDILSAGVKGKLIIDCSTIHPDTTNSEARRVEAGGGRFVACPVFGAAAMADAGQLICVLAGQKDAVDEVKPFCAGVMGKSNIDLSGEEPGQATRLKVLGNSFVLNMVEALSEGLVVAEKSGLGGRNLHKFIEIMFPGPYTAYSTRMLTGDYYKHDKPLFSVDLARKDARHAQSIAQQSGTVMRNVELADNYLKIVQEHKGSAGELAAMYGAKRLEAGLPFEN
ncbi:hypothetical protein H2200_005209 [Cladophialophora chaetospira]|uniref:Oxidoreductase YfjR n=1 Tax=Cladophialophora chaetospira TaxID=386627 RepID=A0AA38XBS2_9EURO|nr:hypothetical protein H2200_005209 [Cladophialophora chaetospira]